MTRVQIKHKGFVEPHTFRIQVEALLGLAKAKFEWSQAKAAYTFLLDDQDTAKLKLLEPAFPKWAIRFDLIV